MPSPDPPRPVRSRSAQRVRDLRRRLAAKHDASVVADTLEVLLKALTLDVAALVQEGQIVFSVGTQAMQIDAAQLAQAAAGPALDDLHDSGDSSCTALPLEANPTLRVLLARAGGPHFTHGELDVARAAISALDPTPRSLRILQRRRQASSIDHDPSKYLLLTKMLHDRDALLEQLSLIQQALSRRAPLQEVLDTIVVAATKLVGDEVVNLRLLDPADPGHLIRAAGHGYRRPVEQLVSRIPIGSGAVGRAVAEERLVVIEDYSRAKDRLQALSDEGIEAAMSAPVREHGRVIGAVTVSTHRRGRTYTLSEQQMLMSFAQHASVALTNARIAASMEFLAFHDVLTGLPNRALFLDRVGHALARSVRESSTMAVLFLDLDDFKWTNDNCGHAAGDELLKIIATRLRAALRGADTAARFGGDEFAVLLEDVSGEAQITSVCERLRIAITEPVMILGTIINQSASIGIATGTGGELDGEQLLRNADIAMYRAKAMGAGGWQLYEPTMAHKSYRLLA